MSKELPFFKFFPSEWMSGKITLEEYELQGIFINICAYYWQRECKVSLREVQARFKPSLSLVEALLKAGLIQAYSNDEVHIQFLDEQFEELRLYKSRLSEGGKRGVEAKRKKTEEFRKTSLVEATLKPPLSIIDKDKEEDKEEECTPPVLMKDYNLDSCKLDKSSTDFKVMETSIRLFNGYKNEYPQNKDLDLKTQREWIQPVRNLIERKKYTQDQIFKVAEFAMSDKFWRLNIIDSIALERNFEKIKLQYHESVA